jgi:hypothetical protein
MKAQVLFHDGLRCTGNSKSDSHRSAKRQCSDRPTSRLNTMPNILIDRRKVSARQIRWLSCTGICKENVPIGQPGGSTILTRLLINSKKGFHWLAERGGCKRPIRRLSHCLGCPEIVRMVCIGRCKENSVKSDQQAQTGLKPLSQ